MDGQGTTTLARARRHGRRIAAALPTVALVLLLGTWAVSSRYQCSIGGNPHDADFNASVYRREPRYVRVASWRLARVPVHTSATADRGKVSFIRWLPDGPLPTSPPAGPATVSQWLGIGWLSGTWSTRSADGNALRTGALRGLSVSLWLPTLILGLCCSVQLAGILRRRRLRLPGRCPACGYDLRATPDRCPECGRAAAVASGP